MAGDADSASLSDEASAPATGALDQFPAGTWPSWLKLTPEALAMERRWVPWTAEPRMEALLSRYQVIGR